MIQLRKRFVGYGKSSWIQLMDGIIPDKMLNICGFWHVRPCNDLAVNDDDDDDERREEEALSHTHAPSSLFEWVRLLVL
ncbi:hypothetical protein ACLOJK_041571 [Asimina triloba]